MDELDAEDEFGEFDDDIPRIIFIPDTYIKDCKQIDQIFEDSLLHEEVEIKIVDKIPSTFTGLASWPTTINIECWYCGIKPKTIPLFLPKTVEPPGVRGQGIHMGVEGVFHSFNCIISYINLMYPKDPDNQNKKDLVSVLYGIITKKKCIGIPPAPDKYKQQRLGGDLTEEEYEILRLRLDKNYKKSIRCTR